MSDVLVTIKIGRIRTNVRSGFYDKGLFMNDNGDVWKNTDKGVVGWMYKPEPMEVDDDDE